MLFLYEIKQKIKKAKNTMKFYDNLCKTILHTNVTCLFFFLYFSEIILQSSLVYSYIDYFHVKWIQ